MLHVDTEAVTFFKSQKNGQKWQIKVAKTSHFTANFAFFDCRNRQTSPVKMPNITLDVGQRHLPSWSTTLT